MKEKLGILIIGPTPPPYAGPEINTVNILNSEILLEKFNLYHLETQKHTKNEQRGSINLRNIWLELKHYVLTGKLNNIDQLQKNSSFSLTVGSIMDESVMNKLISECELVYHLAAAVGVKYIIENPLKSIQINICGTEIILEKANRYKKKLFLSSTSEIYGKATMYLSRRKMTES